VKESNFGVFICNTRFYTENLKCSCWLVAAIIVKCHRCVSDGQILAPFQTQSTIVNHCDFPSRQIFGSTWVKIYRCSVCLSVFCRQCHLNTGSFRQDYTDTSKVSTFWSSFCISLLFCVSRMEQLSKIIAKTVDLN
jgi:hypothetical protein